MAEPWLSAEEIAAHLGITKDAVYDAKALATVLTPRADELVASHSDKSGTEEFLVDGFNEVFRSIRSEATAESR